MRVRWVYAIGGHDRTKGLECAPLCLKLKGVELAGLGKSCSIESSLTQGRLAQHTGQDILGGGPDGLLPRVERAHLSDDCK